MSKIVLKSSQSEAVRSFADTFRSMLDGESEDRGTLEAMQKTAENNSEAIGRLVEVLYENGCINMKDTKFILGLQYSDVHFEIKKD